MAKASLVYTHDLKREINLRSPGSAFNGDPHGMWLCIGESMHEERTLQLSILFFQTAS